MTRRVNNRETGLRLSALAWAVACANAAWAQPSPAIEQVVVIGQAVSIDNALLEQLAADSIINMVHADGIGQLPDDNVAEAVQRLPGASVERDQGEGRFVSVRGLGPDLNSVSINGTLVPAPEADRRAVALDVLPSELVQSLSIVKTLTPDMDANSLGGSIAVESLSAFDHDGLFYSVSGEGSFDDNTDQTSPKFSGAFSNRFSLGQGTDNFGVAAAVSWQKRKFGSDNVETGGAWDLEDGERLEQFEQRDYAITRERTGLGLNFDYRPDDRSNYYLRTLYSRYQDTETRNAAIIEFEDPLLAGEVGAAEGARELKDREETQEVQSYVLGGERRAGAWTLSAQAGYSRASEDTPGHIAGATFEGDDPFFEASFRSTRKPRLGIDAAFYDPARFSLDEVEWAQENTKDTEHNARLDLSRDFQLGGHAAQVKFGGKLSRRDKDSDVDIWTYEDFGDFGFDDDQLTLDRFARGPVDYSLGRFGPGISAGAVKGLLGGLDREDFYNEEESRINDFSMQEDIDAAYVMQTLEVGRWRLVGGLRYEATDFTAKGTGLRDGDYEAIEASNDYDHWLPSLHARYQIDDNTQFRAAWTNSVVRPTFAQLAPGFVIDGDEASFGNPELDALESMNFDVGIERYLGKAGVVSAFAFYKDIENFVYATDLAGTGDWTDFDEAATFDNGDRARLYGIELAYSQQFDWLPAPWNGLLMGANLTFSKSEARIEGTADGADMRRDIDLPNQSDRVGNLMLGWENDRLSVRVSANYKSEYLMELAAVDDAGHDLYADEQLFVDVSAHYFLTKQLQLSFEAQNLTDESFYVYAGRHARNGQYEEYGPTFKLGVTFTHF